MSDGSETSGRCRREMDDFHGSNTMLVLADAIDRLAADVAAVKEATLPKTTEERDCALRERDEARAEVERLRAELAARPAATGWLTDEEREVLALVKEAAVAYSDSHVSIVVEAILDRAGSPPVVEVPKMGPPDSMTTRESSIHILYRAALDKSGVPWKEVPRE